MEVKVTGGIAEISESVEKSEQYAPECRFINIVQANEPCGSHVLHQCPTLYKNQRSQEGTNVCVIYGDGDVKNIQLSDGGSDFAGFSSANSIVNDSDRHCVAKRTACILSESKVTIESGCLIVNNTEQERLSLYSTCGSLKNEVDVEILPDIKKSKKMLNVEQSPVDQIIEINSNSTTSSEPYKRQKFNSKHKLHLFLQQHTLNSNSHYNKCSTETTSDFPVSSPSNPHERPGPPLKTTLPADSFERSLSLLTAQTPQMSLDEKINSWKCDLDLSDVEDVGSFDDLFKQHEELKQKIIHGEKNLCEGLSENQYDFTVFRNNVLPRINAATSFREKIDKLSNCSHGTLSVQRRMRVALEFECKKRQQLELLKGNRAVTPTFTSSSENDMVYNSVSKPSFIPTPQKGFEQKLRHRNSENSNKNARSCVNLKVDHSQSGFGIPQTQQLADEIPDFKARCLYKVIDKSNQKNKKKSRDLIQMRLNFEIQNKSQHLHEKRSQLFKTPTAPQHYLPSLSPILLPMPTPITLNSTKTNSKINYGFTNTNNTNFENQLNQSEDYKMPIQNSSASLRETNRPCSAFSPSLQNVPAANFHQQHEFCNYLGLTGMSTANAVANAVAELAKCNLTRRSLRVRRLKQQKKKENNQKLTKNITNDDELVQTLKCEGMSASLICVQEELLLNHGKISEELSENKLEKLNKLDTIMNERSKSDMPIVTEEAFEKEPEIKIVCKISSKCDKEKSIEGCSEQVTAPMRQTLLRYLNPINSNDTSTWPRSSISDVDGERNSNPTPNLLRNHKNNLQSDHRLTPTQISTCSSFKNTMTSKSMVEPDGIKQQLYDKFKNYLDASRKLKPSIYIVQTLHNNDPQQSSQPENKRLVDVGVETSLFGDKNITFNKTEVVYNNESPQLKKSNDKIMKINQKVLLQSKRQQQLSLLSKKKKKERVRKLLAVATSWHKIKNQRYPRNRKILLVKRIKSTPIKYEKLQKNRTKSNQSEHCSTVSLEKTYISNSKCSKSVNERNNGRKIKYKRLQKTRLITRSTPSPADTSTSRRDPKTSNTVLSPSTRTLHATPIGSRRRQSKSGVFEDLLHAPADPATRTMGNECLEIQKSIIENETVVVSSTTNSYDEATLLNLNNNPILLPGELKQVKNDASHVISTKDHSTQSAMPLGIHFLNAPSQELPNPVRNVNGKIDYVYYEMDVLIIVQEKMVSFWKYFKLINILAGSQECEKYCHPMSTEESCLPLYKSMDEAAPKWLPLGECRRLATDIEISTSYANRICVHNSIPIYVEMRCREIPRERRNCNLLSMYINVYYFNDEDMVAKMHSIQLDAVQGMPSDVIYTTITESRYFVMSWPQENILGKPRSGLCKYSLTPNLDTLASIRDFKHMRHCIRYLECTTDDKLIGFGDTQLTIWDHRSGDVLMNYDFNIMLGQNIGSIYYPSLEIGQNNVLILFQYMKILEATEGAEVLFIACSVSHTSPSHRILKRLKMPSLAFNIIQNAINTGDNIIITAENDEEIWINCADPTIIARVPPQYSRRFYPRGKSQIIELTCKTLTVDSFANHVLKLAANPTADKARCEGQV